MPGRRLLSTVAKRHIGATSSTRSRARILGDRRGVAPAALPRSSSATTPQPLDGQQFGASGHLFLGEGTIKTHVSSVLTKLGLRDRMQAVIFAYESGLIEPGQQRE
jgi:hypothetical protein